MEYFKPYEGDRPYLFISYAHANSDEVMRVVNNMHERGYRIWYDEGIEVGSEWPECIAEHLAGAHLVIAFISNAYMKSDNCRREMHFTLTKRKKIINVFLENTEMTPGMEMQIGNIFALMKYTMGEEQFFRRLYSAPLLNSEAFADAQGAALSAEDAEKAAREREEDERRRRRGELALHREELALEKERAKQLAKAGRKKRRKVRLIAFAAVFTLLLAAAVTLGIVGYSTGIGERLIIQAKQQPIEALPGDTAAVFEEEIFERIARTYSGKEQGDIYVSDLAGMNTLYICEDVFACGEDSDLSPEWMQELYPAERLEREDPLSLEDLKYFTGLLKLRIQDRELGSLETLPGCGIETLRIDGCGVRSLEGIGRLTELRELSVGDRVTELGDIKNCLQLRSIKLTTNVDLNAFKPLTKISEMDITGGSLDSMRTVMRENKISHVTLRDCDLRGSFFKKFDKERRIVSLTLIDCKLDSTANLNDFTGLTTLHLERTGDGLDWSQVTRLPALKEVYADMPLYDDLEGLLETTAVELVELG